MKRNYVMPRQKSLAMPEISNPFVLEQKHKFVNKLQVAVMSVTVAPVRLILFFLLLLMAWALAALGVAFLSEENKLKPLSGWRLFIHKPFVALGRAMFFVIGFYIVRTKGLIKLSQPILVQREDPDSRMNTIKEIQRRGHSGGQFPQVIIFPEGTCTNGTCLISFKLGAFYSGLPVQPVCLKYPNKLDTTTWTWEGPGAWSQLWLTLCQFYTRCEIEYLPVYTPSEVEKASPRLYADNVRAVMAVCLKLPTTEHTFDDCRLMIAAKKLEMPSCVGLVEFEKLHSKLGIKFDEMKNLLIKFNEIKGNRHSKEKAASITYDEFSDHLLLPKSEALQQVFNLYDRDGSGTIDFREYVIGLSLVSAPVNNDDTIDLAFALFDTDNNGYISQEELQTLLGTTFHITDEDSMKIFHEVNISNDGKITKDEFKSYAMRKPEYAKIFTTYRELKIQDENLLSMFINDQDSDFEQWGTLVDGTTKKLQ